MMRPSLPPGRPQPPDIDSPVFQRAGRMTMQVRQPDSPWTVGLGVAVAVILGVIVFVTLSEGRQARADAAAAKSHLETIQAAPAASAPIVLAQTAPPPAPAVIAQPAPAPAPPVQSDDSNELHAPLMVVDQSGGQTAPAVAAASGAGAPRKAGADSSESAEERFAAQVESGGVETSHATRLADLKHTIAQGTVIPAVLETAINSDLPGSVRAVVSRDVTGFDGSQVLIPRGSKLIGQYRSGMAYGQSRAFVIWSRILTPDGVSIEVGSPGVDPLGRGGLAGETDTHFFERFGSSILLSAITAGMEVAAQSGAGTSVIIGSPLQASSLAAMAPQQIPVTIKVKQGTPLEVFLVRDLDFSGVAGAP